MGAVTNPATNITTTSFTASAYAYGVGSNGAISIKILLGGDTIFSTMSGWGIGEGYLFSTPIGDGGSGGDPLLPNTLYSIQGTLYVSGGDYQYPGNIVNVTTLGLIVPGKGDMLMFF